MTDYKAIKGKTILNIASDLDNAEGEGEIWFNTTSSDYKTIVKAAGSWSTGGSLNTGRSSMAATGTRDVGLAIGGGEPANSAKVESYDGQVGQKHTILIQLEEILVLQVQLQLL